MADVGWYGKNFVKKGTILLRSKKQRADNLIDWRSLSPEVETSIPINWVTWLSDRGSLTDRLIDASENEFRVDVIDQCEGVPLQNEALALGISADTPVLIRRVVLQGKLLNWVFARSILPMSTLTGDQARLKAIDDQPLGALLFADASMTREPVEVAHLPALEFDVPEGLCQASDLLWGRRSVFRLDQKPLLVSEIFLPTFTPAN